MVPPDDGAGEVPAFVTIARNAEREAELAHGVPIPSKVAEVYRRHIANAYLAGLQDCRRQMNAQALPHDRLIRAVWKRVRRYLEPDA